ncbi:MAG: glutelin [Rhizobacter sp.]|nr:glutelin [Rhizobacter sp.]
MNKVVLAVLVSTAGLCAGTAHAGNVFWSVGISAPGIGTVISNVPAYPEPVYVPAPVYSSVYAPLQVYAPVPVYQPVYQPAYRPVYGPEYTGLSAPVAFPRYGSGYRPVPVVYWRGQERHHWQPRRDRDDRGEHHHGGRRD